MKVHIGPYSSSKKSDKPRRIKIHIDSYDVWSLDHTLSLIIAPALKMLKDQQHGYPGDLEPEQWDEILDKMIFSFNLMSLEGWPSSFREEVEKVQEGLDLFAKYFMALWD